MEQYRKIEQMKKEVMEIQIAEEERARIEQEMVPLETTIRYCRKLYDDYKQERKELNERRESVDENDKSGDPNDLTAKKNFSLGSSHKRNASHGKDDTF